MADLFLKIINMSIAASWLVPVVLAFRFLFRKAPKWVHVLLWGMVAVRLICPFSIESGFSLLPSAETIPQEIMMDRTPEISTGLASVDRVINPIITETFAPEPMVSANPLQILIPVFAMLWIIGMCILALYTMISYWRLRHKVSEAVILRANIFQSENVGSPFVLGIIKPRIYLPYNMDAQDLEHVVAHEQAHIRRKDHLWKPLGFLLLTVHWFNPLLWLAYILLCRDIELACDEKVIRELGSEQRADYTQALVACSVNRRMIAACPLAFGEVSVKARVKSVLNYKKPAFWVITISVIACAAVAVCFLTNPEDDAPGLSFLNYENAASLCAQTDSIEAVYVPIKDKYGDGDATIGYVSGAALGNLLDNADWEKRRFPPVQIGTNNQSGHILFTLGEDYHLTLWDAPSSVASVRYAGESRHYSITEKDYQDAVALLTTAAVPDPSDTAPVEPVWFTPDDIYDIEYMELVWHDGQHFTPLTDEGYKYITVHFSAATEIRGGTGCPFHSVLYLHRSDGVVGKVLPAEDSCDVFQSDGKYYQFGDRSEPPYSDSSEAFYRHFGTSVETLPHYQVSGTDSEASMKEAILSAILNRNKSDIPDGLYHCASFVMLDKEEISGTPGAGSTDHVGVVTVYGLALHQAYSLSGKTPREVMGSHISVAITFEVQDSQYSLLKYWEPRDGTYYIPDIREKFPDKIEEEAMNTKKYIAAQKQECLEQAMRYVDERNPQSNRHVLSAEELAQFNERFYPIAYDKQGNSIEANPLSGFFSSYYDDVRNLNFEEFMRYFPGDGSFASDAEFEALKGVDAWPFDWVETRDDMPVPIHKYQARIVDMVLKENAGITTADLDISDVAYLPEYDAFYNYTSDFGPGMFTCTRGEVIGDTIRLYEEFETGTDMLTLRKVGDNYQIVAHQCLKGDNTAEIVYGR